MSFDPVSRLDGKIAVVTGGLGAIGYATATRLAALGATCVLLHRGADDAAAPAAALPAPHGQRHGAIRADVVGDALAKALAPEVRVVSVSPGAVESGFVPGRGAEFADKMAATTPLGRIGRPDDVAATVEALATTLRFVTGTRIVVDGGRHL